MSGERFDSAAVTPLVLEVICWTFRRTTMFDTDSIDITDEEVEKRGIRVKTLRHTEDSVTLFSRVYLKGENHTFCLASHSKYDFGEGAQEHHVKLLTSEGRHLNDFTVEHRLGVDSLLEAVEIERHLVGSLPAAEWHAECRRRFAESPPETRPTPRFFAGESPADNR